MERRAIKSNQPEVAPVTVINAQVNHGFRDSWMPWEGEIARIGPLPKPHRMPPMSFGGGTEQALAVT